MIVADAPPRPLGRAAGALPLTLSSVAAAALGWATLLVVARATDQSTYSSFAILWGIYYGIAGICAGLQQEVTRATADQASSRADGARVPLASVAAGVGAVLAVAVLATYALWRTSIDADLLVAGGLVVGVLGLVGLVVVLGALAGSCRWRMLAGLLLADAVVRILAVALAVGLADSLAVQAMAIAIASWVWVPLVLVGARGVDLRAQLRRRVAPRIFTAQVAGAMAATGCASLLVAGFPWLLASTSREPIGAETAGLLAALVFFRSPVLVLVYGLRPLILRSFLAHPLRAVEHVVRTWLGCLLGGGLLAVGAYFAGPGLLRVTFGTGFDVEGWQAATLVLSSMLLSMATVSSLALLAVAAHRSVVGSWVLAVVATLLVLALPIQQDRGLLLAAVIGPIAALAWHATQLPVLRWPSAHKERLVL